MTTAKIPKSSTEFRLPDPPKKEPDEMTSYDHLHQTGNSRDLVLHFGNPETTLVEADRWVVLNTRSNRRRSPRPDLLIAFNVSRETYRRNNGYVVSEQGKPPDFVMEVASVSTAENDLGKKRDWYEGLGVLEYWRFDETGEYYGTTLAGDRLVAGRYQPIPIEELTEGGQQGFSAVLNLYLRAESGRLGWHDPTTGQHIATHERERAARLQAEARIQELEAEISRLRGE